MNKGLEETPLAFFVVHSAVDYLLSLFLSQNQANPLDHIKQKAGIEHPCKLLRFVKQISRCISTQAGV